MSGNLRGNHRIRYNRNAFVYYNRADGNFAFPVGASARRSVMAAGDPCADRRPATIRVPER
jgi:hypothetical protein